MVFIVLAWSVYVLDHLYFLLKTFCYCMPTSDLILMIITPEKHIWSRISEHCIHGFGPSSNGSLFYQDMALFDLYHYLSYILMVKESNEKVCRWPD